MRRIFLLSLLSVFVFESKAQQITSFDHYLIQQYFVNPAAAGMNGTNVFLDYRKQWSGFAGAPETQVLAIDGSIKRESMGLGLLVTNDQVNILGSTSVMATYAYRVKFDENHFLRFGLSAGLNQNRIIFDRIVAEDPSELQIFQNNENASAFDGAGGLLYEIGNLKVGLAVSHLFGGSFYYENNFQSNSLNYQNIRHYLANAQYRFDLKKYKWSVMPSVQMRTAQGVTPLYEGAVTGMYNDKAWMTVRYSNKVGVSIGIGGIIAKNIVAGYAYSLTTKGLTGYNQGSHDIIIGFKIKSRKGDGSMDPKLLEELNRKNNELHEQTDFLKNENERILKELEEQRKILKNAVYGLDSLRKSLEGREEELRKIIEENQNKLNNLPDNSNNGTTNINGNGSNNGTKVEYNDNGTEKAKTGDIYVVIGAVTKLENAKMYQKMIMREYGEETKIIGDDKGFWFFIYTKSFTDKEEAIKERTRAININTKDIYIGKPWYFVKQKN